MRRRGQQRRWYRLHVISWLALLVIASALVEVNLDSRQGGSIQTYPPPPCRHGWPRPFLVRSRSGLVRPPKYSLGISLDGGAPAFTAMPQASRWPFDDTPVTFFSRSRLILDMVAGGLIVVLAVLAIEVRARNRQRPIQFSLKLLLTVMAWAATCFSLVAQLSLGWELILSRTAIAVLVIGIALAWAGLIDLAGLLLRGAVTLRRRHASAAATSD